MKWTRLTIKTTTQAEDIIISEMYELGLQGAQIEDNVPLTPLEKEQMFVDILPEYGEDDGRALLHFFVEVAGQNPENEEAGGQAKAVIGLGETEDNSYSFVSGENVVSDLPGLMAQMEETLSGIRSYMDIGEGTIEVSETADTDWANNWKEFFKPFAVEDLLIIPSWIEVKKDFTPDASAESSQEDSGKKEFSVEGDICHVKNTQKILRIDPGSAFGTGMHETTRLCMKALKEYNTPGSRILDVGTGSGILGIVALLQGADHVVGTDLDICAKEAVAENLSMNGIPAEKFKLKIGNIITDQDLQKEALDASTEKKGFDIVVANILAQVLCPLTPVAAGQLKTGGIYITSGILEGAEDSVTEACKKAGLEIVSVTAMGEWRCVVARKQM
ncbi:MAG: 50S ribosomal protein L11 methyltransferase [Lachnospiraceae bacterium]|nr:50S ribosomal protein L11 methyltransferase [Lachnospiraceae bacterium]